jgi:hypothetical protein
VFSASDGVLIIIVVADRVYVGVGTIGYGRADFCTHVTEDGVFQISK